MAFYFRECNDYIDFTEAKRRCKIAYEKNLSTADDRTIQGIFSDAEQTNCNAGYYWVNYQKYPSTKHGCFAILNKNGPKNNCRTIQSSKSFSIFFLLLLQHTFSATQASSSNQSNSFFLSTPHTRLTISQAKSTLQSTFSQTISPNEIFSTTSDVTKSLYFTSNGTTSLAYQKTSSNKVDIPVIITAGPNYTSRQKTKNNATSSSSITYGVMGGSIVLLVAFISCVLAKKYKCCSRKVDKSKKFTARNNIAFGREKSIAVSFTQVDDSATPPKVLDLTNSAGKPKVDFSTESTNTLKVHSTFAAAGSKLIDDRFYKVLDAFAPNISETPNKVIEPGRFYCNVVTDKSTLHSSIPSASIKSTEDGLLKVCSTDAPQPPTKMKKTEVSQNTFFRNQ